MVSRYVKASLLVAVLCTLLPRVALWLLSLFAEPCRAIPHEDFLTKGVDCRAPAMPLEPAQGADLSMVHVVYSDSSLHRGLLHSLLSVSRHLGEPERCSLHLVVRPENMAAARQLAECFRREREGSERPDWPALRLHELRPMPYDLETLDFNRPELKVPETFVRLFLHEYLPSAPRALWLDTDTIATADVAPLYRMPMRHVVAAAWDFGKDTKVRAELKGTNRFKFNTGVLLVDLAQWRAMNVSGRVAELMPKYGGRNGELVLLNKVFERYDRLDWRWNLVGLFLRDLPPVCIKQARILHWSWFNKPWYSVRHRTCRGYDHFFEENAPKHKCRAV